MIHSDIDSRLQWCCIQGINDPVTERMPFEFVKAEYNAIHKRAPSGGGSDFGAVLHTVFAGFLLRRGIGEGIHKLFG